MRISLSLSLSLSQIQEDEQYCWFLVHPPNEMDMENRFLESKSEDLLDPPKNLNYINKMDHEHVSCKNLLQLIDNTKIIMLV